MEKYVLVQETISTVLSLTLAVYDLHDPLKLF